MEYKHEVMQMDDYGILNELIDDMTSNIFEELDSAKKYAMNALKHKNDNKSIADAEIQASSQEYGHAEMLIEKINKMFSSLKSEKHDCYDWLILVWHKIHERILGYMGWIKGLHEQYKK